MRIKNVFAIEIIDQKYFMVCLDSAVLSGMIEMNETAAFIVNCMSEETTIEEIAKKLCATFDVSLDDAICDVEQITAQLKDINAIED